MITDRLIPNVDQRISAWISIQERLARQARRQPKPTITLSRQFGCEGYPLAECLKETLEKRTGEPWTIFDKALIERVSRETDLSERLLGNLGDESHGLDKFAPLIPKWRTHSEAYEVLARYILRIAQEGNAIIVGRGGAVVTQHLPRCFHFRLEAPFEHRVQSIQGRLAVNSHEAERIVNEHQKSRERFLESFLHCSIADTRYYHAVFNSSKNKLEAITRSILELVPVAT
jgi:cytidylate kinase